MDELAPRVAAQPEARFDELRVAGQQRLCLDAADEEAPERQYHLDEGSRSPYDDEHDMCAAGAAAATTARKQPSKAVLKTSTARSGSAGPRESPNTIGQFNDRRTSCTSNNNNEEDTALRKQRESEMEQFREDAVRWKRELQHVREEKREIEEAFRRLDQEIASGYNLVERKEKELEIAELITKNQKVAHLLEKELKAREELRASHVELLFKDQSQTEQLTLLHGVLSTLETKHASLKETHATLKSSYEAALATIEQLQDTVNQVQAKLIHAGGDQQQRLTDYEQELQSWERRYTAMERKCVECDHRVQVLAQGMESLLENKAHLERELGSAHDQLIRVTGFVKTMEAKLEASIQDEQARTNVEKQLDALQDKFHAAAESNEILKSALEQTQQHPPDEGNGAYLRLTRENYLLSSPYQIDLLMGYTGAAAFREFPSQSLASAAPRAKHFAPFRVESIVKRNNHDNQQGEGEESRTMKQFAIVAGASDANGASYLNRTKIAAFLQFIQSHAAKKSFKELIFTKLAEYTTKLRELKFQFGTETTTQRATIQMLQREVDELKHKLETQANCLDPMPTGKNSIAATSASSQSRRKLLMKLMNVHVEKQQQHRQSTFLTQTTCSSDVLISNGLTIQETVCECLDLSECSIDDDGIVDVLLKIQVSGVAFHEIRLDSNALTDDGATRLAHFLEKCPSCVKLASVNGNALISHRGIDATK